MTPTRLLAGLAAALALLVAGALAWAREPALEPIDAVDASAVDPALVERGARLAAVGNCIACHTVPGGQAFAGGLPLPTPFGTLYSTNITPDASTGIGRWSEAAFRRALHEGVGRDGRHLYPAFPYTHYTLTSDEDVAALYAYLMTRAPAEREAPANALSFPFGFRPLLAAWKLLFFDEGRWEPVVAESPEWNRGAYLAEGLGHCGGCHTPRNAFGATIEDESWAGGEAEGWSAYPIDETNPAPVPWDADALAFYLRHGWHPVHGVSRGPMAEVTGNLGRLPDEDIRAIAVYTAARMGEPGPERVAAGKDALAAVQSGRGEGQSGDTQVAPVAAGASRGAAVHAGACSTCHSAERPQPYGGLDFHLSTAVHADSPQNIVNVTLFGLPPADGVASAVMPAYRGALSDADMVALLEHLRATYTDELPWEDLERLVADTRSGAHHVTVRPADMIERAPGNLGAEARP